MKENIGVRFVKHNDKNLNSIIGDKFNFEHQSIINQCNLHYIDVGQSDKIHYYANKEIDLCLRFEEEWDDDKVFYILTYVYHYPEFYEKSAKKIDNDLIELNALGLALQKQIKNVKELGQIESINEDTFVNCQIEAYKMLKKSGKLKEL